MSHLEEVFKGKEAGNQYHNSFGDKGKSQRYSCKRFGYVQEDFHFGNQYRNSFVEGSLFFICRRQLESIKTMVFE